MLVYTPMPHRTLLHLSGEDVEPFLQSLLSNDIRRVTQQRQAVYAALLNAQGRLLYDMIAFPWAEGIALDCERSGADGLSRKLAMYRLRSRVAIAPLPDVAVFAAFDDSGDSDASLPPLPSLSGITAIADPRHEALGWRLYGTQSAIEADLAAAGHRSVPYAHYDRHRLQLGIADGSADMKPEKALILEYGLEDLHGVDFAKGCYVGQEVTARTKYRGLLRKFIHCVETADGSALPASDTPVTAENQELGILRSSCGASGLALLRVREVRAAQAAGTPLIAGGTALQARLPGWVRAVFEGEAQ